MSIATMWAPGMWMDESAETPITPTLAVADNGDGTGAIATISGGSSNATNTIYTQQVETIWQQPIWQTSASRAGNGAVPLSLAPGHYLVSCLSQIGPGSVSTQPVYLVVTASALSVKTRILAAVQTRLRSLGLDGIDNGSVVVTKIPTPQSFTGPSRVPLPGILVSDIAPEAVPPRGLMGLDDIGNPIQVTLAEPDNQEGTFELNHARHALWRERISRAFRFQRLPGVPEVIGCTVEPSAPIDAEQWKNNYYVSALTLRFTSRETRGA
jgi:hypothetical protein